MSQKELAENLSVSTQAVSRWETSVNYPDITLLPFIASVFNITVDYLLGADKFKNDKLLEEMKETYHNYATKGDNVGCYEYMKNILMLKSYNYTMHVLAMQLILKTNH